MGSISRMSRCDRFAKVVGPELLKTRGLQVGKLYEVVSAGVSMSEDGNEVSKAYYTLREHGPAGGDEEIVTTDEVLFDPEQNDVDTLERVTEFLSVTNDEDEMSKMEKKAKKLLRKAELIGAR